MKTTFRTVLCAVAVVLAFAYCQKSNESEEGGQEPIINTGALNGKFSVSPTKMVYFSKGNLQATINEKGVPTAWKFAANQYDFLGEGGANKTIRAQAGDVDLFGWSTASNTYGISTSERDNVYIGDFVDWGKAIGDGKTWRTLSNDEWKYLLEKRTNASYKFGLATVAGYHGIIILPDNFKDPQTNIGNDAFVPFLIESKDWNSNIYTIGDNWDAMEQAGAVFLPAAGYRYGSTVDGVGDIGGYWSSTADGSIFAYGVSFTSGYVGPGNIRSRGYSVRLITESK